MDKKEELREALWKALNDTRAEPGLPLEEVVEIMKDVLEPEELSVIIKLINHNA